MSPEGVRDYGCICGPIYTHAGVPEPGQFDADCPEHGDQESDDE